MSLTVRVANMRVNHVGFLSGLLGPRGRLGAVINLLSGITKLHARRCTALMTLRQPFRQLHSDQGGGKKNDLQITASRLQISFHS